MRVQVDELNGLWGDAWLMKECRERTRVDLDSRVNLWCDTKILGNEYREKKEKQYYCWCEGQVACQIQP